MFGSTMSRCRANLPLRQLFASIAMIGFLAACVFDEVKRLTIQSVTLASGGICDPSYSGVQNTKCLWVAAGQVGWLAMGPECLR